MKETLFKSSENIYKANLHCHTTHSDGRLTPEEIKKRYSAEGYSIVAFTDHNVFVPHNELTEDHFLAINACEININGDATNTTFAKVKTYHLNFYAKTADIKIDFPLPDCDYNDIDSINRYIKARSEDGFLICYNHPYWSMQSLSDFEKLEGCFAMEIYNHGCEAIGCYGYNPQSYDEMLRSGKKLFCMSTDDNHNVFPPEHKRWDSFGGFTMINAEKLEYGSVIKALEKGDFYSSQGPQIHEISLDEKQLNIKCSEAEMIVVYTKGRKCYVECGDHLTSAEFTLLGDEEYIRVMVRDKNKKDANSNAYWISF